MTRRDWGLGTGDWGLAGLAARGSGSVDDSGSGPGREAPRNNRRKKEDHRSRRETGHRRREPVKTRAAEDELAQHDNGDAGDDRAKRLT